MSNSIYIECEDDIREDLGESLPSAPLKEKRRVETVEPEPQEEKVTPDNFKYNIGDIIRLSKPDMNLVAPANPNPERQYHDNLRVIFRFYDGNHVYIVEAEDGIGLITPEQDTELVERSTAPNTPPDNKPEPEVKTVSQEEYFREVSTLNGKIRQLEQQCADERQKTDREKDKVEQMLHRSAGCLDAVKAMLESSGGATHRMRDFYAEAMVKFIGNAKATLQSYAEPEPF